MYLISRKELCIAIVSLVVAFSSGCDDSSSKLENDAANFGKLIVQDAAIAAVPQPTSKRVFRDTLTTIVRTFGASPENATSDTAQGEILYTARQAVVDADEKNLYIVDRGSNDIKQFDITSGAFVRQYGKGEGAGPGEFGVITGMALFDDGRVLVVDNKNRRVTIFDAVGEVLTTVEVPMQTVEPAILGASRYLLFSNQLNGQDLFYVYKDDGELLYSFGRLSTGGISGPQSFLLGGASNGKNAFIATGHSGGGLIGFSDDQSFRFFRETMDHNPFPRWVASPNKDVPTFGQEEGVVKANHIVRNIWNNVFYELVSNPDGFYVDAFDLSAGDYLYTFSLPDKCGAFYITDQHVYANCLEQGFLQFKR